MIRNLFIYSIGLLVLGSLTSCGEEAKELPMSVVNNDLPVTDTVSLAALGVPDISCTYNDFHIELNDTSFKTFYYNLIKSLRQRDTVALLNSFADQVGFSKYECDEVIRPTDCDGCLKCTKRGIIRGTFGRMPLVEVCEEIEKQLTCFGVGPMLQDKYYAQSVNDQNAYANMNFKDSETELKFYDYSLILILQDSAKIYSEPKRSSSIVKVIDNTPIAKSLDVGGGEHSPEDHTYFREYENESGVTVGYLDYADSYTGFDFTMIVFTKVGWEWKITQMFEPPGC